MRSVVGFGWSGLEPAMKTKMKIQTVLLYLALGLGTAGTTTFFTGCTTSHDTRDRDVYAGDQAMSSRVRDAFNGNDSYKFDHVQIACTRGNVQLSGYVEDPAQKFNAAKLAKTVPGVASIENVITIKTNQPPPP
jgi:hypothetical protein